jgi:hypothetical protein
MQALIQLVLLDNMAALARCFFAVPTIFTWDLSAGCRMLRLEAKSP